MPARSYHFDDYLYKLNADQLKTMARLWGGDSKLRKEESLGLILSCLRSPSRIQVMLKELSRLEISALALLKAAGGSLLARALVWACGPPECRFHPIARFMTTT
jgi:hypothetical protein